MIARRGPAVARLVPGSALVSRACFVFFRYVIRRHNHPVRYVQSYAGKIMVENSRVIYPASRHDMGAFLAKTEAMTETAPAKNEIVPVSSHFKTRTFDHLPPKTAPGDYLEIPAADNGATFAFECNQLCASRGVALADDDPIQPLTGICPFVTLHRPGQPGCRDSLYPPAVRH